MERYYQYKKKFIECKDDYREFLEEVIKLENEKFLFMINSTLPVKEKEQKLNAYDKLIKDCKSDMETCQCSLIDAKDSMLNEMY
ncbi:MAG: hypothetical protein ACRCX2_04400 [Paraclostridium sp.]